MRSPRGTIVGKNARYEISNQTVKMPSRNPIRYICQRVRKPSSAGTASAHLTAYLPSCANIRAQSTACLLLFHDRGSVATSTVLRCGSSGGAATRRFLMPDRLTLTVDRNTPVSMRDGTVLYADVY